VVKGFLKVWETNMKQKQDSKDGKLSTKKMNQVCEKVIQMILSLQVPAHTVIAAVTEYVEEK